MSKTARTVKIADSANEDDGFFGLSEETDLSDETVYIEEVRVFCDGSGDTNEPGFNAGVLPNDIETPSSVEEPSRLFAEGNTSPSAGNNSSVSFYDSVGDLSDASFDANENACYDVYVDLEIEEYWIAVSLDRDANFDIYLTFREVPS